MRRRLTQGVIAVMMVVAVALTGVVRPAPAHAAPAQARVDIAAIIKIAKDVVDLWKSFQGGGMSVEEATRQILAAINTAKTDIIAHMDRLVAADARSCATRHVIELADIDRMTLDTLQAWAQNATSCVTTIDAQIGVVADKAALDALGTALDVVGPIALIARSRAGFTTGGLQAVLVNGNNSVLSKLAPDCYFVSGINPPYITRSVCVAYNGDRAEVLNAFYDDALRLQAMRNTSWVVAYHAAPLFA